MSNYEMQEKMNSRVTAPRYPLEIPSLQMLDYAKIACSSTTPFETINVPKHQHTLRQVLILVLGGPQNIWAGLLASLVGDENPSPTSGHVGDSEVARNKPGAKRPRRQRREEGTQRKEEDA